MISVIKLWVSTTLLLLGTLGAPPNIHAADLRIDVESKTYIAIWIIPMVLLIIMLIAPRSIQQLRLPYEMPCTIVRCYQNISLLPLVAAVLWYLGKQYLVLFDPHSRDILGRPFDDGASVFFSFYFIDDLHALWFRTIIGYLIT